MPNDGSLHTDRARAESFGSVAADYDRYRSAYPDALIGDLVELAPTRVLDVACGTGKLAVALQARGLAVLGVEIDEQMAEVAREHGVTVETDSFEGWDDRGRTFDLITCGQGWHWIDPDAGARKAARLLRPGGALALCWNYEVPDDELRADLDRVYREHAPELAGKNHRHDQDGHLESLRRTNAFATIETKRYRWAQTLTADEWVGRVSTFSDHIGLAADRRERLLAGLRELAEARGGALDLPFGTYTTIARTPE